MSMAPDTCINADSSHDASQIIHIPLMNSSPLSSPLIEVRAAAFGYARRSVVQVDALHLRAASCLGLFGPNGAGKTTLIRGITGLLPPLTGDVRRATPYDRPLQFGYMPQHRAMEPGWPMTALDAASLGVSAQRRFGWINRADRAAVHESLAQLTVSDLADRPFSKLSGGQQQRVLLAGALAARPDVLLLDEPTDGLDVQSRQNLLDLLRTLTLAGLCIVMISHEIEDLMQAATQIAWLRPGAEPGDPSTTEMITPATLAERVLNTRRLAQERAQ